MGQVHLCSELAFIERFADEGSLLGEHGYCLATFQAALGCLRSLTWREIEDAAQRRAEIEEEELRNAEVGTPDGTAREARIEPEEATKARQLTRTHASPTLTRPIFAKVINMQHTVFTFTPLSPLSTLHTLVWNS